MAQKYPVAGCKFYISTTAFTLPEGDVVAADFTALTFVEIGGWETMGSVGDTAELITTQLINEGRDAKLKGTRNAGSMENTFAVIPTNAGQLALIAAEASSDNYAFRIEMNDAPATGASPTNGMRYFAGIVMGAAEQGGSANTVRMLSATVEVNTNIVTVPPSAT
ncbi:hypothetical protein FPY71_07230 [Aureimonas fodinaquatilis]|uniref:Uncharacterized protein n=1 Tax=Aureimonas fodinaquatilis TaxID=2565783 RepID=A0A5B0DYN8_9HYPH|nr:hypothetical protein [Aureimonas fodinaquatilis]KAA0970309.1 hypothetical protein FPY71_07230 [Aureimonas fodinaquatilis]